MFIEDVNGNLVNTRHIIKIRITEPELEQETFEVVADISYGSIVLSKHETYRGAKQSMNKYIHMD